MRLPRNKRSEIVLWLHDNVGTCETADSDFKPTYLSTTAQIAEWRGKDDAWRVMAQGPYDYVKVQIQDEQWAALALLKWGDR